MPYIEMTFRGMVHPVHLEIVYILQTWRNSTRLCLLWCTENPSAGGYSHSLEQILLFVDLISFSDLFVFPQQIFQ